VLSGRLEPLEAPPDPLGLDSLLSPLERLGLPSESSDLLVDLLGRLELPESPELALLGLLEPPSESPDGGRLVRLGLLESPSEPLDSRERLGLLRRVPAEESSVDRFPPEDVGSSPDPFETDSSFGLLGVLGVLGASVWAVVRRGVSEVEPDSVFEVRRLFVARLVAEPRCSAVRALRSLFVSGGLLLLFPEPEVSMDWVGELLSAGFSLDDELLAVGATLLLGELSTTMGLADGDGVVPVFDEEIS
jgi:hypothetical protein